MDLRTLLVISIVLLATYGLTVLVNSLTTPGLKGSNWFALSMLSGAVGCLLIVSHRPFSHRFSILAASFLVLAGFLLLHLALRQFLRVIPWLDWLQVVCVMAGTSATAYFTYVRPDTATVMEVLGLVTALQAAMMAGMLFLRATECVQSACSLAGASLLLSAGISLTRVWATVHYSAMGGSEGAEALDYTQSILMLGNICAHTGIAFGFVWMTATRLRSDLQHQAITDELTGVLNRRALEVAARREMSRSRRTRTPLVVVMMDLDGFKQTNDMYGHLAGDTVLCAVAKCLQQTLRQLDTVARVGGDEFIILLPGTPLEAATEVVERLRFAIQSLRHATEKQQVSIRASFGVAWWQGPEDTWPELMARADEALYVAKTAGGNRVHAGQTVVSGFGVKAARPEVRTGTADARAV